MTDQVQEVLRPVVQWAQDDPLGKLAIAAGAVVLTWAVGLVRRRKERPERVRVNIDCPPGEKVFVQLGDDDEESK